jgi:hypothetical protein
VISLATKNWEEVGTVWFTRYSCSLLPTSLFKCYQLIIRNAQRYWNEVEQGVLRNGKAIAVKKLSEMQIEDTQFHNEVTYLIGLKHQNIVQLVGYCAESRWEATQVSGKYVMAEIRKRLLCFEYVNNKSLDKYLSGMITSLFVSYCIFVNI